MTYKSKFNSVFLMTAFLAILSSEARANLFNFLGSTYSADLYSGTQNNFSSKVESGPQVVEGKFENIELKDYFDPYIPQGFLRASFFHELGFNASGVLIGLLSQATVTNESYVQGTKRASAALQSKFSVDQTALYSYSLYAGLYIGGSETSSQSGLAEVMQDGSLLYMDRITRIPTDPKNVYKTGEVLLQKGKVYALVSQTAANVFGETSAGGYIRLKSFVPPPPPVPEPTTIAMLLGVCVRATRRRRNTKH